MAFQVRDWTEEETSNQGLLVIVQGLGGAVLEPGAVQFASGRDHHESKKPMLVLFTDDGRRGAALPTNSFSGERGSLWPPIIRCYPLPTNSKMEVACSQPWSEYRTATLLQKHIANKDTGENVKNQRLMWNVVLTYILPMGHRGKDRRFSAIKCTVSNLSKLNI